MISDFKVEEAKPSVITIRHVGEGHRYLFYVVVPSGRRMLGNPTIKETIDAMHSGVFTSTRPAPSLSARLGRRGSSIKGGGAKGERQ